MDSRAEAVEHLNVSTRARYAVIPTRDRPAELDACLAALGGQCERVVVIDNASDPPVQATGANVIVLACSDTPPNLSKLWNLGLDHVAMLATARGHASWDVAVVNDDAIVGDGWLAACAAAMRANGGYAASSDQFSQLTAILVHRLAGPVDLRQRLCGYGFILAGEAGLRADETLAWWYGDDDLDWRARQAGGTVIVPGFPIHHTRPNQSTVGTLAEQAGRDRVTFAAKWGQTPW